MKRYRILFKDGSDITVEASYGSIVYSDSLREAVWQGGDTLVPMLLVKAIICL